MAARDDSERLVSILDDLLDINRIESGKSQLALEPATPRALVRDAMEPFLVDAKDKGVTVVNACIGRLARSHGGRRQRFAMCSRTSFQTRFDSPAPAAR